jgi:hypothetical protein
MWISEYRDSWIDGWHARHTCNWGEVHDKKPFDEIVETAKGYCAWALYGQDWGTIHMPTLGRLAKYVRARLHYEPDILAGEYNPGLGFRMKAFAYMLRGNAIGRGGTIDINGNIFWSYRPGPAATIAEVGEYRFEYSQRRGTAMIDWFRQKTRRNDEKIIRLLDKWAAAEVIGANNRDFVDWLFEYWPIWVYRHRVRNHGAMEFGRKYIMRSFEYVVTVDPACCCRLLPRQHDNQEIPEESKPFLIWLRRNMQDIIEMEPDERAHIEVLRHFEANAWSRGGDSYNREAFRAFRARYGSHGDMVDATSSYRKQMDRFKYGW